MDSDNTQPNAIVGQYELLRRIYLKDLYDGKMVWTPTRQEFDKNVEISRIFRSNPNERLAFMRIRPGGFRASRSVPKDTKLIFHSVQGRCLFLYKGKKRYIEPGKRITIAPRTKYSARSLESNETVYLVLRVIDVPQAPRPPSRPRQHVLAIMSSENIATSVPLNNNRPSNDGEGLGFIWTPTINCKR